MCTFCKFACPSPPKEYTGHRILSAGGIFNIVHGEELEVNYGNKYRWYEPKNIIKADHSLHLGRI